jgi:hypothetical protein
VKTLCTLFLLSSFLNNSTAARRAAMSKSKSSQLATNARPHNHSTIIFASSIDMTSTFPLTSSPVGVSTPIVEKVTAPPLALTVSSPHLTNTDDCTHDRKRKRDDVFLSPPSVKKKSRDNVFLSPPSARTKSSGRRRQLKAKPRSNRLANVRVNSYVQSRWRNR